MAFIDRIKEKAKKDIKTIVLPEAIDLRILRAAKEIKEEGFAIPVLIGDQKEVLKIANQNSIDIDGIKLINPLESDKCERYANTLYELRKEKGMTLKQAEELIKDSVYFGMIMVKVEDADGLVSGAIHSTADTLRPALQILKTAPETKLVSTFFVMCVEDCDLANADGTFVFADCALMENPTSEQLSEIAISSGKSYEAIVGGEARVGMLSYSTYGSNDSEMIKKVVEATRLAKEKAKDMKIDGELQLDAAIIPEVAKLKAPKSDIAGTCNTLIFPDINSANIGYKLVQRFAHAEAYGPICQGISKPVNDLSRGCLVKDIVGTVALTALQASLL